MITLLVCSDLCLHQAMPTLLWMLRKMSELQDKIAEYFSSSHTSGTTEVRPESPLFHYSPSCGLLGAQVPRNPPDFSVMREHEHSNKRSTRAHQHEVLWRTSPCVPSTVYIAQMVSGTPIKDPGAEHLPPLGQQVHTTPGSETKRRVLAQKAIDVATKTPLPGQFGGMTVRFLPDRLLHLLCAARCILLASSETATVHPSHTHAS